MATYKSFKQLNKKTLKEDDVVHFKVGNEEYIYKISDNHLMAKNHTMNNEILTILRLSRETIDDCYGYANSGGIWPACDINDYEALTRAVLVIYLVISTKGSCDVEVLVNKNKWRKIEILIPPVVDLNSMYEAILNKDHIKVGCQRISYKAVEELYMKAKELNYL